MKTNKNNIKVKKQTLVLVFVLLISSGIFFMFFEKGNGRRIFVREPRGIMGTSCTIAVVVDGRDDISRAGDAIKEAEKVLRRVEGLTSVWLDHSQISKFNSSPAGSEISPGPETMEILRISEKAFINTKGAFDITCGPLIKLWKDAGKSGALPSDSDIIGARSKSNWELLEFTGQSIKKLGDDVKIDLGGIAKGYAIDLAIKELKKSGAIGGMVDVGGDLAVFGLPQEGDFCKIEIKDPFKEGKVGEIEVTDKAVCTSGDYARFFDIQGTRYSHIIDPRSGKPAKGAPSVTVVAQNAVQADIWATALSVTGPQGVKGLPEGIEASFVLDTRGEFNKIMITKGFPE